MRINKVITVVFSPTGTTRKAVRAFAAGTGIQTEEIDLTLPKDRQSFNRSFGKDEMLVAGLPVYAGRLPKNLEDFFGSIKGDATPAAAVVMYGNREYNDALIELRMKLEERGFAVKAGVVFIGEHTFSKNIATGRPDAGDLAIAAGFGKETAAAINADVNGALNLKGNYPFTWKGYDPSAPSGHPTYPHIITADTCTQCGLCADNCPWGIIDKNDLKNVDHTRCMRCFRCIKNCPVSAKLVKDEVFLNFIPRFEAQLNARRCEPELYLPQQG